MKRHLFILHLWPEPIAQQQLEWRGRIVHVDSSEVRFFRDPVTLYQTLLQMLPAAERDEKSIEEREWPGDRVP